jgi:hypothetical protein
MLLHLGLGQCVEIANDGRPGSLLTERGNAGLQLGFEHEGEEAAEHVSADGLVKPIFDTFSLRKWVKLLI